MAMIKNVLQVLENTAQNYPNRNIVSDPKKGYSYAQFVNKAKQIGTFLYKQVGTGKAIAVAMDNSADALVSFMGIIYSGNYYVPLDKKNPFQRVSKILDTLQPVAIIIVDDICEWDLSAYKTVGMELFESTIIDETILSHIRINSIDTDPIYALFTSGSTGNPKGVVCCHRSVINYATWIIDEFAINENDVLGNQVPFYFSMSVFDIYATIFSGAELTIIPPLCFSFPKKLIQLMVSKKINVIYWVPTVFKLVQKLKVLEKLKETNLEKIFFAGEVMPAYILNMWRHELPDAMYINMFGPTEITDIGLYYVVDREFSDFDSIPIGKPCNNVGVILLDDDDKLVEPGNIGEICFRGSFLACGYFKDKYNDETKFVQNPLNNSFREIIYRTGDLGSVNEYGEVIYHGRKDFQIKRKGIRIELGEIETAVSGLQGMTFNCCIYNDHTESIVLVVEGKTTLEEMLFQLEGKIPEYMLPNELVCVDRMPINANGKIDRNMLKQMVCGGRK